MCLPQETLSAKMAGIGSTGGGAAETVKPGQTKITIEIAQWTYGYGWR